MEMPINYYDGKSAGAESYRLLAEEVIHKGMKNGSKEKRIGERPGFTYTGISGEKADGKSQSGEETERGRKKGR